MIATLALLGAFDSETHAPTAAARSAEDVAAAPRKTREAAEGIGALTPSRQILFGDLR